MSSRNRESSFSILDELRKIGIKILMDDFGTGYSSLSSLKRFKKRIDTLKIDQSFINALSRTDAEGSNFITKTIIQLAHHLEMLKEYNCNNIQGYLFSKPLPADGFAVVLEYGKMEPSKILNPLETV
ncbi:EAL domain-containing protein [Neobacillus vireti]|uniref:EAL domain-containing protein n=1 Tax=Neobacillus vireti TaxID=220686 RepID=UPI00300032AE